MYISYIRIIIKIFIMELILKSIFNYCQSLFYIKFNSSQNSSWAKKQLPCCSGFSMLSPHPCLMPHLSQKLLIGSLSFSSRIDFSKFPLREKASIFKKPFTFSRWGNSRTNSFTYSQGYSGEDTDQDSLSF